MARKPSSSSNSKQSSDSKRNSDSARRRKVSKPNRDTKKASKNAASGKVIRKKSVGNVVSTDLLSDVRSLIEQTRDATSRAVNSALVLLYWSIGDRIRREILKEKRAEYGEQILQTLSAKLVMEYGSGYSRYNLARMVKFAELFPASKIVAALSQQLGWSHFIEIIPLKDQLKRDFYAEMCRVERWSVRTLRQKIQGMLFERTALSQKPDELIERELAELQESDQLSPDMIFRDPYILDFLGLKGNYSEKDLEDAIIREIESFILELGSDFSFVARQYRMTIDGEDFHLDLLFYHRKLRCLVAIDLKLSKFSAADKGQMELYLCWLDKYERHANEESPIGLILCEAAGTEHVELLQLNKAGIRVATYLTELPPKSLLEQKLRTAARLARERLGQSIDQESCS